ncbi:MAG: nuclear transport factor 2 family protein [Terracidiphilus sp.]|jgi:ketosteroid isomerase-like protein
MATATMSTLNTRDTRDTREKAASKDEADILALVESMLRANHDKDAAAFAAPFAPDAAVFNLAPPLVHHGIDLEEKRAWYESWATPVDLESRDLKVSISGDLAFCHGFLRLTGTKRGAEGAVSFWMRETLCLERIRGEWKIVHEHTSVPFYMDATLRPAFDLQP